MSTIMTSFDNFNHRSNSRHIKYMFEFRIRQCDKFIDHKCTLHKPYNCFDWHFPNQRRRVPQQMQDGTFNYNPDLYCNSYDQNTGICPNDPGCQYVHMNVGDTERRYHPRYYKTGMCIYETGPDGVCGKNGIHCAFAHDQSDMRQPLLDIRETMNNAPNLSAQLEKERVLTEDPIWNEMDYVLAFYKTEECRKLPKTCRQGYACPYYHNSKDRRRLLLVSGINYQSQPCPRLKPVNEEWQDVAFCLDQDNCKFSHSRTEQQFHPEIFKSSKCNDILRDNFCPRGPFCAFCHNEVEMNNGQYSRMLESAFTKYYKTRLPHTSQIQGSAGLAASSVSSGGAVGAPVSSSTTCLPTSNIITGRRKSSSMSTAAPGGIGSVSSKFINPRDINQCLSYATNNININPNISTQSTNIIDNTDNTTNQLFAVSDQIRSHSFLNVFHRDQNLSSPISTHHSHLSSERSSPASCPARETGLMLPNPSLLLDNVKQIHMSQNNSNSSLTSMSKESLCNINPINTNIPTEEDDSNQSLVTPTANNSSSFEQINLKTILERALSSSSNVQKMSENEIGKLLAQYSQDQQIPSPKLQIDDGIFNKLFMMPQKQQEPAKSTHSQDKLHLASSWKSTDSDNGLSNDNIVNVEGFSEVSKSDNIEDMSTVEYRENLKRLKQMEAKHESTRSVLISSRDQLVALLEMTQNATSEDKTDEIRVQLIEIINRMNKGLYQTDNDNDKNISSPED